MQRTFASRSLRWGGIAALALLAGCVTPPPPPPPPPAPVPTPTPAPIPSRPTPPDGAALSTPVPPIGPDGVRLTVNAHLSAAATTWNLRSGLNVAALNCLEPEYAPILAAYKVMLTGQQRKLAAANKAVEAEFRGRYGAAAYRNEQDQYMTQVYNYFALPPVRHQFCATATEISNNYMLLPPDDLDAYAAVMLPKLEMVFTDFYTRFENYRLAVADWDARYGAQYGASQLAAATADGSGTAAIPLMATPIVLPGAVSQPGPVAQGTPVFVSQPVVQAPTNAE